MLFKDIKEGDEVYMLEINPSTNVPTYMVGKITGITNPSAHPIPISNPLNFGSFSTSIDVIISVEDQEDKQFTSISTNNDYITAGKYRVATTKEKLNSEVKRIYEEANKHINNMDNYRSITEASSNILQQIGYVSPSSIAETKMSQVENKIDSLSNDMAKLVGVVNKLVNKDKIEEA